MERAFGADIDYAMLVKHYGPAPEQSAARRYSPAECLGTTTGVVTGNPDQKHISTSYAERQNLNIRMGLRRFTRLTNASSKKVENHFFGLAIYFMYHNYVRIHQRSDTFVVVGFDVEKPGRVHSLHLAWSKPAGLIYAGSVEIGIDDATAREPHDALTPLRQARSPLSAPVKGVRPKWVKPQVLVEVAFPNVSEAGRLRHPKLRGLS